MYTGRFPLFQTLCWGMLGEYHDWGPYTGNPAPVKPCAGFPAYAENDGRIKAPKSQRTSPPPPFILSHPINMGCVPFFLHPRIRLSQRIDLANFLPALLPLTGLVVLDLLKELHAGTQHSISPT